MNYQKQAGRFAESLPGAVWANQFDNVANRQAHDGVHGPGDLAPDRGRLDAFVAATGTGGTLAGVGRYLKGQRPDVRIVLADPMGSALYTGSSPAVPR
jgi:cysteine synthase